MRYFESFRTVVYSCIFLTYVGGRGVRCRTNNYSTVQKPFRKKEPLYNKTVKEPKSKGGNDRVRLQSKLGQIVAHSDKMIDLSFGRTSAGICWCFLNKTLNVKEKLQFL